MRICLTVPSIDRRFGGPVVSAAGLAEGLRTNGHNTIVVGCGEEGADVNLPAVGRFHATPIPGRLRPIIDAVKESDIVHVLGYRDPVGTVAMLSARRRRIPFIVEPLGMYGPHERSRVLKSAYEATFGSRLLRDSAAIVVTSELEARQFDKTDFKSLMHVRPNGIDSAGLGTDLPPGAIRETFGIPGEVPLVISLGRVTKKKRIDHLIQAMGHLDGYWLLIVGPDSNDGGIEMVEDERERSGIGDRIVLRKEGIWGRRKVRALLDSDCFCLPSSWETSSIAILEAAALGIPVVASDRCGGMEFLGPAGELVAPFGDPAAIAKLIRSAVENGEVRDVARSQAQRLRDDLNWTEVAARQVAIYEATLAA